MSVLTDLVDYLDANVASLTKGTNLFWSRMRAASQTVPVIACFVTSAGGPPPITTMGNKHAMRFPIVDITLRHRSVTTGEALIREIQDLLQDANISGYLNVDPIMSEPTSAGPDEDGNFLWTLLYSIPYNSVVA